MIHRYGAGMINLMSDTQTRPTDAMRRAIAAAEVGDEQLGTDPTVRRLCDLVAEQTGQEDAVLLPSGTMANLIAAATWCRPGDSVIVGGVSHSVEAEAASFAAVASVLPIAVPGDGRFTPVELEPFLAPGDHWRPTPRLVLLEQTVTFAGGIVWQRPDWDGVVETADRHDIPVHVDGARLFNAEAATGILVEEWASQADSVYVDFTKGLGAPFGAVLAGSASFIDEASYWKHRLGGAMRQAGIMAAGCIHALEHHRNRLGDDHQRAAVLGSELERLGCSVTKPDTNMILFDPPSDHNTHDVVRRLEELDVLVSLLSGRVRVVTHLDIDDAALAQSIDSFRKVLA